MTVVAFDGFRVAADKRMLNNGVAQATEKIWRVPPREGDMAAVRIIGITGDLALGLSMRDWWLRGADPTAFPKKDDKEWACLWCFGRDVQGPFIYGYEGRAHYYTTRPTQWAAGSGRDFALAAMHLGRDAAEAVAITNQLTIECGNGVDVLVLGP